MPVSSHTCPSMLLKQTHTHAAGYCFLPPRVSHTETGIQAISAIPKLFLSISLPEWSQTSSADTPLPRKPISILWAMTHPSPGIVYRALWKSWTDFGQELSFCCVTTSRAEMNSFLPRWGVVGGDWHTRWPYLEPSHLCPPHWAQFLLQVGAHPPRLGPRRRQAYFSVEQQSTEKNSLSCSDLYILSFALQKKMSSLNSEPKVEESKKATPNHISWFSLA